MDKGFWVKDKKVLIRQQITTHPLSENIVLDLLIELQLCVAPTVLFALSMVLFGSICPFNLFCINVNISL